MNLKNQLKAYLQKRRLSPAELARRSGVARQVIADWIAGKSPRNLTHVQSVAKELGTDIDNLCFGNGVDQHERNEIDVEEIIGNQWISGLFEVKLRRVKKDR